MHLPHLHLTIQVWYCRCVVMELSKSLKNVGTAKFFYFWDSVMHLTNEYSILFFFFCMIIFLNYKYYIRYGGEGLLGFPDL